MNDILLPNQSYCKMYGKENSDIIIPGYKKIPIIINTMQKCKLKIHPDMMNKRHHVTRTKCISDQQR